MYNKRGNKGRGKWLLACFAALTAGVAQAQTSSAPPASYTATSPESAETPGDGDARFRSLFRSWAAVESMAGTNSGTASAPSPAPSVAPRHRIPAPPVYSPPAYLSIPPAPVAPPRYGCSEAGSCYGDISPATGRPKTVYVPGYFKSNGKYVRGYYRSN